MQWNIKISIILEKLSVLLLKLEWKLLFYNKNVFMKILRSLNQEEQVVIENVITVIHNKLLFLFKPYIYFTK